MKYYLYLLIILPFVVLPLFFAGAQTCQSEFGGYCADLASLPYAQISGLEFLGDVKGIGDLISKLYVFGVGLAALAAFIMFTVGGVAYLTAGDNESQVTKARGFMKNAAFGLAIALLSWLILFTINPDLVKTLDLQLEPVKSSGGTSGTSGTFGGSNVGDTRVETGAGQVVVQDKLTGVDQCTQAGQTQIKEFCKKCLDGGGKLCRRADDTPISSCTQNYICLK